ncbi:MAG: AzlD domain-containing protein [Paludibacterium sp.]|uniref:AzlD domain-containing protein n=1 Tax=Paludibacterium sp. TaxID=1917523 RepID=UPI0025E0282E|nr:AzlD domain-containing protein [Paludibacterium sp.]MBV8048367.1 AzlD domain-containing protein [Paludibacterium sp.]MBV8647700.1 AzlD domain-containing protein [Paludibacterium sp.]
MTTWWMMLGMVAVTQAARMSFLVFGDKIAFPAWLNRALHFVPVAVLTALIVPMALAPQGHIDVSPRNAYLVGTLVALAVALPRGKTLPAIVASFVVYGVMRGLG